MERVFDDEDFNAILDQRKKVKLVFYIVLGAYIALGRSLRWRIIPRCRIKIRCRRCRKR